MRYHVTLLAAAMIALAAPAFAADDAAWDAAYKAVMANPNSREANENYLKLTLARGDYEAAIAPLERLSMQSPNDMGLLLQIGEMYQKLGSEHVAKSYFKKVAASDKSTPEQVSKAQQYL